MSQRANIATWRRSHPKPSQLPNPHAQEARTENGSVCPVCLRFGRDECSTHGPHPEAERPEAER